jgi:DeoR family fructose operon transcriptional repressor
MYAPERYRSIVERVVGKGRASVTDLADDLAVTPETIRRDLSHLERQGLVRRVHGGAVPTGRVIYETPVAARDNVEVAAKAAIAQAALAQVPTTGAVIVDAGTTTDRFLELIPDDYELTIITNSVAHAFRLSTRPNLTALFIGGRLRPNTLACVDQWALDALAGIYADVALVGTNGVSVDRGLTTPDPAEASVKRAMLRAAGHRVVLADHTKFGVNHFAQFGSIDDFDVLVTDRATPSEQLDAMNRAGKTVVIA